MTVINPFDFFLEDDATEFPFAYGPDMLKDLMPFLHVAPAMEGSPLAEYVRKIDRRKRRTIDFLVELNSQLQRDISYTIRMEPGVQTCDETLQKRSGSCRDTAWLLVNILRRSGLAARFVSGYLIQLTPDVKSLDGPAALSMTSPISMLGRKSSCRAPVGLDSTRRRADVRRGAYPARLHARSGGSSSNLLLSDCGG